MLAEHLAQLVLLKQTMVKTGLRSRKCYVVIKREKANSLWKWVLVMKNTVKMVSLVLLTMFFLKQLHVACIVIGQTC
ncbi:hypothetical protein D3C77_756140 [compost metagenome]